MSIFNSFNIIPIEYPLQTYYRSNQDTTLVHRPVVQEGDWVQAGDLISDAGSSFGGEFSIGQNLLIAYLPWEGYNYEDAILISERLVYDDLYTSIHIERYDISTEKTPYGNEIITKDIMLLKETTELEHLDENGVAQLGSWLKEGDILVGKITPTEPKKEVARYIQLYNDILGKKMDYSFRDTSLRVPRGLEAKVIRVQMFPEKKTRMTPLPLLKKKSSLRLKGVKGYKRKIEPIYLCTVDHGMEIKKKLFSQRIRPRKSDGEKGQSPFSNTAKKNLGFLSWKYGIFPRQKSKIFLEDLCKPFKRSPKNKKTIFTVSSIFLKTLINQKSFFINKSIEKRVLHKSVAKTATFFGSEPKKNCRFFGSEIGTISEVEGNISLLMTSKIETISACQSDGFTRSTKKIKTSKSVANFSRNDFRLVNPTLPHFQGRRVNEKLASQQSSQVLTAETRLTKSGKKLTRQSNKSKTKTGMISNQTINPTSITSVHVYLAEKRKVQVGDKMAGRHGNKGIISQILPRQDMPYLPDGSPIDLALNPLGVPSRMNVGQIYECLLGLAGKNLGEHYRIKPFDESFGSEASRSFVFSKLYEARLKTGQSWIFQPINPGKLKLFDGRTGKRYDQPITTGYSYMIKLVHLVDEKIHSRSSGPYSLITQQPLKGRSKHGGQRLGEMEVWAIEAYGAAFILLELLTIKSDDVTGRLTIWDYILYKKPLYIGTPASFKVLICELQALCLDIGIYKSDPSNALKQITVSTMG
uniref:DNA-directed RNA polymerase n=1 Tax=Chaetophoropsis polyrhiza TaxID=2079440 RepID=A0A6H1U7P6_9CHLO|nr:beta subunit of RNA polymerase [Chaetophoropsis polyrhiza]QIZ74200.1 beta subunit of RNA polymerase [Chaetophoropsis polyrhiza]